MSDDGQARFPGKLPGKSTRNGLPEFRPYRWRDPGAAREAQVKALLAGIRAQLTEEEEGLLGDSFDDPFEPDPEPPPRQERLAIIASLRMNKDTHRKPIPGVVTAAEAARRLGVSKRTIERYKRDLHTRVDAS